ncbi:unnamed protein product [Darwinula stevensoni]|uniref:FAS1 domain-containing protein n=1 Tax=Darwinula stevensoni TaxID=69355 RepID=A0A7R8X554_9CRUS|nr:unnamed protein product [Darwinula stevensoni]CAG0880507.1 unnamed protein product [Darwinula stevensoni]
MRFSQRAVISIWNLSLFLGIASSANLLDLLAQQPDTKEFHRRVSSIPFAKVQMETQELTVFAPNDEAMRQFEKAKRAQGVDVELLWSQIWNYHFANLAMTTDIMEASISSELKGSAPIWVNKVEHSSDRRNEHDNIYVNNAKIIRRNIRGGFKKSVGDNRIEHQMLHVIDEVLEPMLPDLGKPGRGGNQQLINPSAMKLLSHGREFGFNLSEFDQVVLRQAMSDAFSNAGGHTFFLPVSEGLRRNSVNKIDAPIIRGHVVPSATLFSRTVDPFVRYDTAAVDNLRVQVSITNSSDGTVYAISRTIDGDLEHPEGTVMAQVIRANIPVRNGVVHLIDRPFMVMDKRLIELVSKDPQMKQFADMVRDYAPETWQSIQSVGSTGEVDFATLLVPSNEAFRSVSRIRYDAIISNKVLAQKMASLHLLRGKVTVKSAQSVTIDEMLQVETVKGQNFVYFHAAGVPHNRSLSVDAGGVNATVTIPDIGAVNGYIHIIDHILGIPYQTVFDKISTDPMMKRTFMLGRQGYFNAKLREVKEKFTYLVPSNEAWKKQNAQRATGMNKLSSGDFSYHVNQILERHMIIGGSHDMDYLSRKGTVQMSRGELIFRKIPKDQYEVEWHGEVARVVRPNLECTNGYIHVIDNVLMSDSDVTVSGGMMSSALTSLILLTLAARLFL